MRRTADLLAMVLASLLVLTWTLPGRVRQVGRDERGDAGGKGLIILVASVLGLAAVVGVGLLITNQISSRGGGLGK